MATRLDHERLTSTYLAARLTPALVADVLREMSGDDPDGLRALSAGLGVSDRIKTRVTDAVPSGGNLTAVKEYAVAEALSLVTEQVKLLAPDASRHFERGLRAYESMSLDFLAADSLVGEFEEAHEQSPLVPSIP